MLLNKVSLGTPSTPIRSALSPARATPCTPTPVNCFIGNLKFTADAFIASSPRRNHNPRVATPIRPNLAQRIPLRQLYAQSTLPMTPENTQDPDLSKENHRIRKRLDRESSSMRTNQLISNMNRRRGHSTDRNVTNNASVRPKDAVSPVPILQGMSVFKMVYETEPMDFEMTTSEIECRQYVLNNMNNANDSMEIDADDETCGMEVDAIVDMESLMDYIPMH